jgi:hypothetical protein
VTEIVQYTFEKLNVYFQNYTEETEKEIARNCEFPKKIDEFRDFQSRKADSQTTTRWCPTQRLGFRGVTKDM